MTREKKQEVDSRTSQRMTIGAYEALENATDAIGMATPQGRHYYQNRAFCELFGIIGEPPPATLYCNEVIGQEVIVSSGYSSSPVIADHIRHGFSGRLIKPFTFDELSEVVSRTVEKR
jgi:PAS domain-containing protein